MDFHHEEFLKNLNCVNLVNVIDVGLVQFANSGSASRHDMQEAELDIMVGWLAWFKKEFETHVGKPEQYMPHYNPTGTKMNLPPDIFRVQNTFIQNWNNELGAMRKEIQTSESAERGSGFHPVEADKVVRPWMERMDQHLVNAKERLENGTFGFFPDHDTQEGTTDLSHEGSASE
jgi:hypothetical protein